MAHLVGRHVVIPSSEWPTDASFENTTQGPAWPGAVIKYTPAPGGQRQRRGTGRTWDVIADVDSALGGQDKCAATVVINLTKLRKWIVINDNEQREDIHDTQRARPAAAAAAAPRAGRRSLEGEARAAGVLHSPAAAAAAAGASGSGNWVYVLPCMYSVRKLCVAKYTIYPPFFGSIDDRFVPWSR